MSRTSSGVMCRSIGARVHGDARARRRRGRRPPRRARSAAPAARIAQRRDLVDVDGQANHRNCQLLIANGECRYPRCSLTTSTISWAQRADLVLVLAFEHHAQQRLGAGVAHEQPALAGDARLDARDRGGDRRHASADRPSRGRARSAAPADRSSGRRRDRRASGRSSAIVRSTFSAVHRPSPVNR